MRIISYLCIIFNVSNGYYSFHHLYQIYSFYPIYRLYSFYQIYPLYQIYQ